METENNNDTIIEKQAKETETIEIPKKLMQKILITLNGVNGLYALDNENELNRGNKYYFVIDETDLVNEILEFM